MSSQIISAQIAGREIVLNFIHQYDEETFVHFIENYPYEFFLIGRDITRGADRFPEFYSAGDIKDIEEDVLRGWRDGSTREILKKQALLKRFVY